MNGLNACGAAALLFVGAAGILAAQEKGGNSAPETGVEFAIGKATLAMTNVEAMVEFYSNVFGMELQEFPVQGETLYSGNIAGMNILLCPNSLAGVVAEQSRVQFDFVVSDLAEIKRRVEEHGGAVRPEQSDLERGYLTAVDPDNNTIVFVAEGR